MLLNCLVATVFFFFLLVYITEQIELWRAVYFFVKTIFHEWLQDFAHFLRKCLVAVFLLVTIIDAKLSRARAGNSKCRVSKQSMQK